MDWTGKFNNQLHGLRAYVQAHVSCRYPWPPQPLHTRLVRQYGDVQDNEQIDCIADEILGTYKLFHVNFLSVNVLFSIWSVRCINLFFPFFPFVFLFFPDYELIVDSDILPNRTAGTGWSTGGFDSQEPAQFEERHLIFLQQLGKVQTWEKQFLSCLQSFRTAWILIKPTVVNIVVIFSLKTQKNF